jgi:hypothetical protein
MKRSKCVPGVAVALLLMLSLCASDAQPPVRADEMPPEPTPTTTTVPDADGGGHTGG